ncbi:hypothetical protein [uncultured Methanobrevibacter sp.]|nr:hypothetical protein [uncultured Methanobrevibacter sp.]
MIDFDKIAEITFLVMDQNQVLIFDNGMIVDRNNLGEFINYQFDA